MSVIIDGEEYFTVEESIKMTDDYIEKMADELIFDLKKARKEKLIHNQEVYVGIISKRVGIDLKNRK